MVEMTFVRGEEGKQGTWGLSSVLGVVNKGIHKSISKQLKKTNKTLSKVYITVDINGIFTYLMPK